MTDWTTVSSLATGVGTLVLAVATFAAVRSANRAARVAERALLAGLRPLLVPSRLDDGEQKVFFGAASTCGSGAGGASPQDQDGGDLYLAASLRNAGSGLACCTAGGSTRGTMRGDDRADPADFTHQTRDLYIPPGDTGFWQGAFRDPATPTTTCAARPSRTGEMLTIDLLYGDHEGGQRMITRFMLRPARTRTRWLSLGHPALERRPARPALAPRPALAQRQPRLDDVGRRGYGRRHALCVRVRPGRRAGQRHVLR